VTAAPVSRSLQSASDENHNRAAADEQLLRVFQRWLAAKRADVNWKLQSRMFMARLQLEQSKICGETPEVEFSPRFTTR
jgi:hypothetical protein